MKTLALTQIRTDGGTQPREQIDPAVVEEYSEQIVSGAKFPPAIVFYDGSEYWLADGFHRRGAYESAGIAEMPVEIRQGTQRDARWFSFGANKHHGLHRDRGDSTRAIRAILMDDEWSKTSQTKIAKHVGVTQQMVSLIANDARLTSTCKMPDRSTSEVTRNGKTFEMKTENIGRKSPLGDDYDAADPKEQARRLDAIDPLLAKYRDRQEKASSRTTVAEEEDLSTGTRFTVPEKRPKWESYPSLAQCITDLEHFCSMPSYQLSVIELKRITDSLKSALQAIL